MFDFDLTTNPFYELGKALRKSQMSEPIISSVSGQSTGKVDIKILQALLEAFWQNGGKEKYFETKPMRDANGIPDSQWFKANLMGMIDDSEITYTPDTN